MEAKLKQRLSELNTELECGKRMITELESRQLKIRESMLRIAGAIQVLHELLGDEDASEASKSQITPAAEPMATV
jgi:hypothetical protein